MMIVMIFDTGILMLYASTSATHSAQVNKDRHTSVLFAAFKLIMVSACGRS